MNDANFVCEECGEPMSPTIRVMYDGRHCTKCWSKLKRSPEPNWDKMIAISNATVKEFNRIWCKEGTEESNEIWLQKTDGRGAGESQKGDSGSPSSRQDTQADMPNAGGVFNQNSLSVLPPLGHSQEEVLTLPRGLVDFDPKGDKR